jgi:hypothetical protein
MKTDKIETREDAIEYAIQWQRKTSHENLSYGELAQVQAEMEQLAKKFNLTEEFRENGII